MDYLYNYSPIAIIIITIVIGAWGILLNKDYLKKTKIYLCASFLILLLLQIFVNVHNVKKQTEKEITDSIERKSLNKKLIP